MNKLATEIEAKFFCDQQSIRDALTHIGGELIQPERLMRRKNFDRPDHQLRQVGGWIRLRDEGNKITLSYKQLDSHTVLGMKEVEVVVDDFQACESFLKSVGFVCTSYHENRRESWLLNGVKIDIDTWPWLPTFVEVESASEDTLWRTVTDLNLKRDQALFGGIEIAYMTHYHLSKDQFFELNHLIFDTPPQPLVSSSRLYQGSNI